MCIDDELMEGWPMVEAFWLFVIVACIVLIATSDKGPPDENWSWLPIVGGHT
jgi:hypothetical protein